jgi:dihydroxyacetone kinase-like predicted kinase
MANSTNIAPLITPEIAATLTSSDQIISFGNQLIKQTLQPIILGNQSVTNNQNNALKDLTTKQQQAGVNKNDVIRKANRDYKNKKITQEQYRDISFTDNESKLNSFMEDIKDKIKPIYEKILIDNKAGFLEEYGQKSKTSTIIRPLHGNEIMTNKNFVYFKETDKNNNPYDWTITLLNSNGQTKTMNLFLCTLENCILGS